MKDRFPKNTPLEVKKLIQEIIRRTDLILKGNLIGAYLHGSLATRTFQMISSDIDLIFILKNKLSKQEIKNIVEYFREVSKNKRPIEASFLLKKEILNPPYPINVELHFCYPDYIFENEPDEEVLAHLYEVKKIGICLKGEPIPKLFSNIPKGYCVRSIIEDLKSPGNRVMKKPLYAVLNQCRSLAFIKEDKLFSKIDGAQWAIGHLPREYRPLIKKALLCYKTGKKLEGDKSKLTEFEKYMLKEIVNQTKVS
jgi:streptomycin 3"-adenylyltransferase